MEPAHKLLVKAKWGDDLKHTGKLFSQCPPVPVYKWGKEALLGPKPSSGRSGPRWVRQE